MNKRDPSTQPSDSPARATGSGSAPRSGSGADTALLAMLKKRQQRASHDAEPPVPDEPEQTEAP